MSIDRDGRHKSEMQISYWILEFFHNNSKNRSRVDHAITLSFVYSTLECAGEKPVLVLSHTHAIHFSPRRAFSPSLN